MSDFEMVEQLSLPRVNRRTGDAERLTIQLTRAAGKHFVSLAHFWLKTEDGKFYPPSSEKPRFIIRAKDAAAVIELLQKLIALQATEPSAPVPIDRSSPGKGSTWAEAATGVITRPR